MQWINTKNPNLQGKKNKKKKPKKAKKQTNKSNKQRAGKLLALIILTIMADLFGIGAIASTAINAGVNFGINEWNNEEALRRERIARQENYMYNERAAENADIRTRALYNDLYSPNAQLEQIKAAGLSPSLMYGDGGGISGQAGAQGAGAGGINPTVFGMSPIDIADIRLKNAEASKLEEEAKTEAGENDRGKTEIQNIIQDTATKLSQQGLNNASEALTKTQNDIAEIENYIAEATLDDNIKTVYAKASNAAAEAKRAWEEAEQAKIKTHIDKKTRDTRVKQIGQDLQKTISEIALNKQNKELSYWQAAKLENDIEYMWQNLNYKYDELELKNLEVNDKYEKIQAEITYMTEQIKARYAEMGVEIGKELMQCITDLVSAFTFSGRAGNRTTTIERYAPSGASKGHTKRTVRTEYKPID